MTPLTGLHGHAPHNVTFFFLGVTASLASLRLRTVPDRACATERAALTRGSNTASRIGARQSVHSMEDAENDDNQKSSSCEPLLATHQIRFHTWPHATW